MSLCRWCGTTEETETPRYGFCSLDCWYEAMGQWDGFDKLEEIEDE